MDLKNNVDCFMRTLSDFHNRIDDFYKLYEARYIADGFKALIDEIFLIVKGLYLHGELSENKMLYTGFCFIEGGESPIAREIYEIEGHPIYINFYSSNIDMDSAARVEIRSEEKRMYTNTKIIIDINIDVYMSYVEYGFDETRLKCDIADECAHIKQMYGRQDDKYSNDKNAMYVYFKRDVVFWGLEKREIDVINTILYYFCSNEYEAHISSFEIYLDSLKFDKKKEFNDIVNKEKGNINKIIKLVRMTNFAHGFNDVMYALDILNKINRERNVYMVMICAYYLGGAHIIKDKNGVLDKNFIRSFGEVDGWRRFCGLSDIKNVDNVVTIYKDVMNVIQSRFESFRKEITEIAEKYIADNKLFESFDKRAFNERVLECLNDLKRNEKYQHCGHFGKPHRSIFESFFR